MFQPIILAFLQFSFLAIFPKKLSGVLRSRNFWKINISRSSARAATKGIIKRPIITPNTKGDEKKVLTTPEPVSPLEKEETTNQTLMSTRKKKAQQVNTLKVISAVVKTQQLSPAQVQELITKITSEAATKVVTQRPQRSYKTSTADKEDNCEKKTKKKRGKHKWLQNACWCNH